MAVAEQPVCSIVLYGPREFIEDVAGIVTLEGPAVGRHWNTGSAIGRSVGLTGMSSLVRRLERHGRRPDVGNALLGVHRHALGAVHRLLGRPRQLRLAADDAAVLAAAGAPAAPGRPGAAADAHRDAGVVQLVLVVERLEREAPVRLLAAAAPLGDVRVVLAHRLRLVNLQLRVQPLQLHLSHHNRPYS